MSITWTSRQRTGMEHQPVSERLVRWSRRKRTRTGRMKERNTSLSWTSTCLAIGQVKLLSKGSASIYVLCLFTYMTLFSFAKLDMVGLGRFPKVAVQPYPCAIPENATPKPLVWFPFGQTRESHFLYHNLF